PTIAVAEMKPSTLHVTAPAAVTPNRSGAAVTSEQLPLKLTNAFPFASNATCGPPTWHGAMAAPDASSVDHLESPDGGTASSIATLDAATPAPVETKIGPSAAMLGTEVSPGN